MPLSFFDLCMIQAMSNPDAKDADGSQEALDNWARRAANRAKALDKARLSSEEEFADEQSERVNKDLEHRSAIS